MAEPTTRVGTEKNRRSRDAYYLDVIKTLERLQSKLDSGAYLSATETEQLNSAAQDFESLRTSDPDTFDRLIVYVNQVRKDASADGTGGKTSLAGVLGSTFSENINRNVKSTQETNRLTRTYVDLPTPEEFLDNFTNAYNIHITNLAQSGAIRPEVAAFAREMQQQVFGEYLTEQTARMMRGEPLWKVVGANAEEKLLGARAGQSAAEASRGTQQSTTVSSRTDKTTGVAPSVTPAGQALDQSTSGTTTEQQTQASEDTLNATEAIMSRNNLAYVANLAPLDFFKDKATAQRLNFLFAGQKGTAVAQRENALGGTYAGARRV